MAGVTPVSDVSNRKHAFWLPPAPICRRSRGFAASDRRGRLGGGGLRRSEGFKVDPPWCDAGCLKLLAQAADHCGRSTKHEIRLSCPIEREQLCCGDPAVVVIIVSQPVGGGGIAEIAQLAGIGGGCDQRGNFVSQGMVASIARPVDIADRAVGLLREGFVQHGDHRGEADACTDKEQRAF